MPGTIQAEPAAKPSRPSDGDDPFSYDAAVDDFLQGLPLDVDANGKYPTDASGPQNQKDVDEEVVVKKQRKVIPKLDENRLLSDQGLPKLRRIANKQLKFRGKGHEFTDVSRLLNVYQLWLDDLYPRAKFRDALAMVEKVGHSRRMQVARRAWIDETKVQLRVDGEEQTQDVDMANGQNTRNGADLEMPALADDASLNVDGDHSGGQSIPDGIPDDDELDMLLAEETQSAPTSTVNAAKRPRGPFEEDDEDEDEHRPDEDELDALLAEPSNIPRTSPQRESEQSHFADDEEAMAELGW